MIISPIAILVGRASEVSVEHTCNKVRAATAGSLLRQARTGLGAVTAADCVAAIAVENDRNMRRDRALLHLPRQATFVVPIQKLDHLLPRHRPAHRRQGRAVKKLILAIHDLEAPVAHREGRQDEQIQCH